MYYYYYNIQKKNVKINVTVEKAKTGNTAGNINNNGLYMQDGDWIYYQNRIDNYCIYKVKSDGTEREKLNNEASWCINVAGDWIYYCGFENGGIYKMKTDGSKKTLITSDIGSYFKIVSNWIYYINLSDNNSLYKIKTDGTGKKQLDNAKSNNINIVDEWIYYQSKDWFYDSMVGYYFVTNFYKIKIDGTGRTALNNKGTSRKALMTDTELDTCEQFENDIVVYNGWIYYQNHSDNQTLYKVKLDGTERTKLNDDVTFSINVEGDWIYYTIFNIHDNNSHNRLYRIKTDGTGRKKLNDDNTYFINIVEDWIYYVNASELNYTYKIKTDGTNRQKIEQ